MKKTILIAAAALIVGYFLGGLFPFSFGNLSGGEENIQGEVKLFVNAKMKNTEIPIPNLEIDLAKEPGPPPIGGHGLTGDNGVAEFSVQPGNYFIYFNSSNFPEDLQMPESEAVTVAEGEKNEKTIFFIFK